MLASIEMRIVITEHSPLMPSADFASSPRSILLSRSEQSRKIDMIAFKQPPSTAVTDSCSQAPSLTGWAHDGLPSPTAAHRRSKVTSEDAFGLRMPLTAVL